MARYAQRRRQRLADRRRLRWDELEEDLEVTDNKSRAAAQMACFDSLGPQTRRAIAGSRFDPVDPRECHDQVRIAQICEQPLELVDRRLADRVRKADDKHSGSFGPAFPAGI